MMAWTHLCPLLCCTQGVELLDERCASSEIYEKGRVLIQDEVDKIPSSETQGPSRQDYPSE